MSKPTRRKINKPKDQSKKNASQAAHSKRYSTGQRNNKSTKNASSSHIGKQPYIWTKNTPRSKTKSFSAGKAPTKKSSTSSAARANKGFISRFFSAIAGRKVFRIVIIMLCLFVLFAGVDYALTWGKIYPGIKVGELDLGGKNSEEAMLLLEDTYQTRLNDKEIYIFANDDAYKDMAASLNQSQDSNYAEQHSFAETQAHKLVWQTNAKALGAQLDTEQIIHDAFALGRENGGIFARLQALIGGSVIKPQALYDQGSVERLSHDIDLSIGEPRVNYGIEMRDGMAYITEGHDGMMIDRSHFENELNSAFFSHDGRQASFVAYTEYAALQIDENNASETRARINEALQSEVEFLYHDSVWKVDAAELSTWIDTRLVEKTKNERWVLEPYVNYDYAKTSLVKHLRASFNEDEVHIRFVQNTDDIEVDIQSSGTMPKTKEAVDALNEKLFTNKDSTQNTISVEAESTAIPESMKLTAALDTGVIEKISEFKTEFTPHVENRNHNIALVSELLNNSIVEANGGEWSFNETAGNCDEDAGFKGAGSIVDGEYVDEIGGGICQVATTVFNAVYNSGLPVLQRHNHSLYIASYPAGRDAAVSWPDLDLRWENNTSSDILMQTFFTDSSISVVLYGVSPGYQVSTETGNWEEGEKYKKRTITDETLEPGVSFVKTYGSDGSKITIKRTVKDKEGDLISIDTFNSVYEPKDELRVEGPKKDEENNEKDSTRS